MRSIVIALGLVLILVIGVSAQDVTTGLTGKGIKAGLNLSNNIGDDVEDMGTKLGFGGGAFITYSFSPSFAIQPELLFMMKGSKMDESMGAISISMKYKLTYLEIPVLMKYSVPTQGNVKPNLFVGPALAFTMGAKVTAELEGTEEDDFSEDIDIKDATRTMDLGIVFGGGVDIKMETMVITFDIRYTMGMSKLVDYEKWNEMAGDIESEYIEPYDLTEDPDIKNTNISFMAGISF